MANILDPTRHELQDEVTVARAADFGFLLTQFETEHGQLVWEWRHGTEPRPQFVARRVALHWMRDWLARKSGPGDD